MGRFGVELLLVVFAALTVLGLLVTYIISVALDHVTPDLPYISDTGGKPPESCVFSLVCNVAIFFELLIVWIRFKHIHTYHIDGISGCICSMKNINYTALLFGLLSVFGFLLVANFQGFAYHVVSTACEWSIGISLLLFFLTFHPDFRRIRLDVSVRLRSETQFSRSQHGSTINESTPLTI